MALSSETSPVVEGYRLKWIVKNISFGYLRSGKVIFGPDFQTDFFSTDWLFFLYFSMDSAYLSVYLQRSFDDGPECISVEIKDMMLQKDVSSKILRGNGMRYTFEKGSSCLLFKTTIYHEEVVKSAFHANLDSLEVRCTLYLDSNSFLEENILKLSNDMKILFENSYLYDTVLQSSDGETRVHRAILEARTNGFKIKAKRKRKDEVLYIPFRNTTESAVKGVMHHLYCGQLDEESVLSEKFLKDAARYQMGIYDFESKFANCRMMRQAVTVLKGQRKTICIRLDRTKAESTHERKFNLLDAEWTFVSNFVNGTTEEYITIRVTPNQKIRGIDVIIRFVIALQSFSGTYLASSVVYGFIRKSDKNRTFFQTTLKFEKPDDGSISTVSLVRSILFSMEIWTGQSSSSFLEIGNHFKDCNRSRYQRKYLDILKLSKDLLEMFNNNLHTDTVMRLPDGELKAHRAILSARSPVFAKYFEVDMTEKASGEIIIEDIGVNVMKMLLNYIYGGMLVSGTDEEMIQLAYAADKYEVKNLRDGCLRYLRQHINRDTALEFYTVLDFLQEEEYKNEVKTYIQHAYFNSHAMALREFRQTRPALFNEIFNGRTLRSAF